MSYYKNARASARRGTIASYTDSITHINQGGGMKKEGLVPSVGWGTSSFRRAISSPAQREQVYYINQIGGVGGRHYQTKTPSDGVRKPGISNSYDYFDFINMRNLSFDNKLANILLKIAYIVPIDYCLIISPDKTLLEHNLEECFETSEINKIMSRFDILQSDILNIGSCKLRGIVTKEDLDYVNNKIISDKLDNLKGCIVPLNSPFKLAIVNIEYLNDLSKKGFGFNSYYGIRSINNIFTTPNCGALVPNNEYNACCQKLKDPSLKIKVNNKCKLPLNIICNPYTFNRLRDQYKCRVCPF